MHIFATYIHRTCALEGTLIDAAIVHQLIAYGDLALIVAQRLDDHQVLTYAVAQLLLKVLVEADLKEAPGPLSPAAVGVADSETTQNEHHEPEHRGGAEDRNEEEQEE